MERLYNDYLAEKREHQGMFDEFEAAIRKVLAEAEAKDIDLRDVTHAMAGRVECLASESVLRRAMNMRRRERQR